MVDEQSVHVSRQEGVSADCVWETLHRHRSVNSNAVHTIVVQALEYVSHTMESEVEMKARTDSDIDQI
jgi:hypothetical protein